MFAVGALANCAFLLGICAEIFLEAIDRLVAIAFSSAEEVRVV